MTTLVTLNVSRSQIEQDLRAGKSVEEIAQDWSEPRANVFAIKRALEAASAPPSAAPAPSAPTPAAVPSAAAAEGLVSVSRLVDRASQSKHARTRNLGAKLDLLVEELCGRLHAEHSEQLAQEAARKAREAAAAEVTRLEAALKEARAKLGRNAAPASPSRSKEGSPGGASVRPAYDGGPPPSVIRTWARDNAVDCPRVGTLPGRVITAYRSAVGDVG